MPREMITLQLGQCGNQSTRLIFDYELVLRSGTEYRKQPRLFLVVSVNQDTDNNLNTENFN